MTNEIFSDGIGEILITGSVVRVDFVSLSTTEKGTDGQPKTVFKQRVVMPLEGLIHSLGILEKAKQKLVEDGRIRRHAETPRPSISQNFPLVHEQSKA